MPYQGKGTRTGLIVGNSSLSWDAWLECFDCYLTSGSWLSKWFSYAGVQPRN